MPNVLTSNQPHFCIVAVYRMTCMYMYSNKQPNDVKLINSNETFRVRLNRGELSCSALPAAKSFCAISKRRMASNVLPKTFRNHNNLNCDSANFP